MPVAAITEDYEGERLDRVENFHGAQVVYIGWDKHLMLCAPFALPLPPDMSFREFMDSQFDGVFGQHPDYPKINWDTVEWKLNGEAFEPQPDVSLIEQGIDHKSIVRFVTPELKGIKDSGS